MLLPSQNKIWFEFDTTHKIFELCYSPKHFGEHLKLFLTRVSKNNVVILMSGTFSANAGVTNFWKNREQN